MRDMQSLAMRRYAEAARAHHNMHPEDEIALHEHHLNSLPFKPRAREHVVNKGLASVAAYVAGNDGLRKQMEGMTDEDQIKARIHGTNSESVFTAINSDGGQNTGNVPCTIETTSTSLQTMRFFGLDCQHPGAGNNVLVINGHGQGNLCCLSFYGSHFEGSNTDTTTPFVSVADANTISFYSPLFNSLDSGTTNWGLNLSQTVGGLTDNILLTEAKHGNGNCVNNTINGFTVGCSGTSGGLHYYKFNSRFQTTTTFSQATTAGTCVQNTVAVAQALTSMRVLATPQSTPGVGAVWSGFVSSTGNVTINECAVATSAGGSITYNVEAVP